MTDLPREHCEKLKDWGMPQDPHNAKLGEWWWCMHLEEPQLIYPDSLEWFPGGAEVFKIHTLDELMEFAGRINHCWDISPHPHGWEITRVTDSGMFIEDLVHFNPKLAVYKLIEKLMEVEREDDKV